MSEAHDPRCAQPQLRLFEGDGEPVEPAGGYTVWQFYYDVFKPLHLLGKSPEYESLFRTAIRKLEAMLERVVYVDELSDELIAQFLEKRLKAVAVATANRDFRHLRCMMKFAQLKGHNRQQLTLKEMPEPDRVRFCWSTEQVAKILRACQGLLNVPIGDVPAPEFWRALVLVLYDTGGRIRAVTRAVVAELNLESAIIRLPAEDQKQNDDQAFDLSDQTMQAVRTMLSRRTIENQTAEPLFFWPYDPDGRCSTLRNHYKRILSAAGLPQTKLDLFQKVRRTTCTYTAMTSGMMAAQEKLGHAHQSTTKRYIDFTKFKTRHSADDLPRPEVE